MKAILVRRKRVIGGAIAMSALLLGAAVAAQDGVGYNRISAMSPAGNPAHGRQLAQPCLACHGDVDVQLGQPLFHPPKLRYQRTSSIFYALQDYRSGQRKSDIMGPFAKAMSDQDMRDLAVYLSARTVAARLPPGDKPALAASWAHQRNEQVCGACHGEAGFGVMDGYPVLAGQEKDYIEHALASYRSGDRQNATMTIFARSLKPQEVPLMAKYFAAQVSLEKAK